MEASFADSVGDLGKEREVSALERFGDDAGRDAGDRGRLLHEPGRRMVVGDMARLDGGEEGEGPGIERGHGSRRPVAAHGQKRQDLR